MKSFVLGGAGIGPIIHPLGSVRAPILLLSWMSMKHVLKRWGRLPRLYFGLFEVWVQGHGLKPFGVSEWKGK